MKSYIERLIADDAQVAFDKKIEGQRERVAMRISGSSALRRQVGRFLGIVRIYVEQRAEE